ncbi:Gfo/Idh/MocA family oxidoreductase [Paenibacillus sp. GSMTC-2017]|uniref:Gfo/Idh/MocA family protein n=1 Tax=Paenibacillus sp. GSMTC-2017 TaxID=2794350 RepID=UPI0018D7FE2F|nr:Gfo/Idh/MocA family oxidoreductase [Paenibacillus sp. GSMTC-2017]MBH5317169.1 Gfo/Idh/MocA family oxidoreductase [Paenibacillus sp. GSMTC-2017]
MSKHRVEKHWNAGIIGAGGWGGVAHIPAMGALTEYSVTAVAGTSSERTNVAAERFGIEISYSNVKEMVSEPDLDVIAVTVKVPKHEELVRLTLEAGKHIYCEWPLARTTSEAEEMFQLAIENSVRHVVGLQARGNPAVRHIKALISDGYVGKVLAVQAVCSLPTFPTATGAVDQAHLYLLDEENGADQLTIGAAHLLDAITFIVAPFADVTAYLETQYPVVTILETGETVTATAPDHVQIGGRLEQGAVVSLQIVNGGIADFSLRIIGTKGELLATPRDGLMFQMDRLIVRGASDGKALQELETPVAYRHIPPSVTAGPAYNVAHLYTWLKNPWLVNAGELPDFEEAVKLHRLLDAIREASSTGRRQFV